MGGPPVRFVLTDEAAVRRDRFQVFYAVPG